MEEIKSRPFKPNKSLACDACVFNSGPHADWCIHAGFEKRMAEYRKQIAEAEKLSPELLRCLKSR